MDSLNTLDDLFASAVAAIDAGDVAALQRLLTDHPRLVHDRLDTPGAWLRDKVGPALDGFFQRPFLLWFAIMPSTQGHSTPVKVLVEAGAALDRTDSLYGGTPLGWAEYGEHAGIAEYLRVRAVRERRS
jgi:hypothetical protein